VLGLWVDAVDPATSLARIADWIDTRRRAYVCLTNVYSVMQARRDVGLRSVFNGAALAAPDGMPLVWMARLAGLGHVQRVYGPDLTLTTCELARQRGYRCYFYGGSPGVADELARRLSARFEGLSVAGAEGPPFRPLSAEEAQAAVDRINASGADVVFVGLGSPRQERWMAEHRAVLAAPILMGVGAAFDFHTGRVRQAPRWMMGAGLEWLFRLAQEPRRLWRRYLLYNPLFVLHLMLELTGLRRYPEP